MRAVVVGVGAAGSRAARQLASTDGMDHLVVADSDGQRAELVADSLGPVASVRPVGDATAVDGADVVLLAMPGEHRVWAERALERGAHVVSVTDDVSEVRGLLSL